MPRLVALNRNLSPSEAMNEIGAHSLDCTGNMHLHSADQHFLDEDAQLQFGKAGADTTVYAITERDMAARILAVDDQPVRFGEDGLVPIGRNVPEDDLVARLDRLAGELGILRGGTPHMRD